MKYLTYDVKTYYDKILDTKSLKILDFGCNHANFLLSGEMPLYSGLDIDNEHIKRNRKQYPANEWIYYQNYNWQYNCDFDIDTVWPLDSDKKYDAIVAFSVFTHTDYVEFSKTFELLKNNLTIGGKLLPTFFSTLNEDKIKEVFDYRKEFFKDYDLIKEIKRSNIATIAVNTQSNQVHFFKNMKSIPRFSNKTYFLTFYNDEWLSNELNANIVDVTQNFSGIMGIQKCISYTHH